MYARAKKKNKSRLFNSYRDDVMKIFFNFKFFNEEEWNRALQIFLLIYQYKLTNFYLIRSIDYRSVISMFYWVSYVNLILKTIL